MPLTAAESRARDLDAADPLRRFRERFHIPPGPDDSPSIYFCSHSLGLQPKALSGLMARELEQWARLGVEGHFHGAAPWYTYQEKLRTPMARLVGARPDEVIFMNGLTVNLHLLLLTFYRPTGDRFAILLDDPPFPSDLYAVKSQIRHHGLDPATALVMARPRPGEATLREEDIEALLTERGREIALVLLNPVNFLTGQFFDVPRIVGAAKRHGCVVGLDLAHAVGNVPVALHDWGIDFAVWCTYKYLCSGPGAVAGAFVHERHGKDISLPRLAGWWGNDPATRFRMQLETEFTPVPGAAGWQVSNPPIFALTPIVAALQLFEEAGFETLRAKAVKLTSFLRELLLPLAPGRFEIITPVDSDRHGCQLSVKLEKPDPELASLLAKQGVVVDFRAPDILRLAPVPLYNTFHEIWRCVQIFASVLRSN
jgi:kynureninase